MCSVYWGILNSSFLVIMRLQIIHYLHIMAVRAMSILLMSHLLITSVFTQTGVIGNKAMVVSAHPLATDVGVEVLRKGGNAVDAMIAVHCALGVVYPNAGNLGGGGFMVWRSKKGETATLDFRETAPALASRDMFLDSSGKVIPNLSLAGHKAVGIPGSVDGIWKAHKRYGKLKWRDLIEPSVRLAEKGFPVTEKQAHDLNSFLPEFRKWNSPSSPLLRYSVWKSGDTLRQPDLANTLKLIRDKGRDGFYRGLTARLIVNEMKSGNGIISLQDLAHYTSKWRTPLRGSYRGYTITTMPPPSSGGVALLQLLRCYELYADSSCTFHSTNAIHLMAEAERRVYADRAEFLGDPDFVRVPMKGLLDSQYLQSRMKSFRWDSISPSATIRHGNPEQYESEQTTHYSIVDAEGNAVSVTTTLNASYGSKVMVDSAGFLLNNEMDDFSSKPGAPNFYGLLGSSANAIASAKRMLSSMTPTIVERDGKLFMVVGTPGGGTIITSVFQTIVNVIDHNMTMQSAVNAKRFHHQWLPDQIFIEEGAFPSQVTNELKRRGHIFKQREPIGRVDAILVQSPNGNLEGAGDPRGDDTARGY
jgi:gamma-glutamyltranspeptidase / glutathione hydrolase